MLKRYLDRAYVWFGSSTARKWIFGLFIVQVVYLIFYMRIGVPPDELTHIRFIEHYANNSLSPLISEQKSDFFLGDVTREISFLYHYLLSLVYRVLPVPVLAKYVIFRFMGLAMSVVTLIFGLKIAKLLGIDQKLSNLSLFIVTNASEWLLMSAAVNNDNAVWMLTSIGIYLLLLLWQKPLSLNVALTLVLTILAGSITKKTFLPIGAVLLVALFAIAWRKKSQLSGLVRKIKFSHMPVIIALVLLLGLAGERLGGNLLHYQGLEASCDQIHTVEQCSEFGVFRRNYRLTANRSEIDTSLLEYVPFWVYKNTDRVFGPQAWTGDEPPAVWFTVGIIGMSIIGAASLLWKSIRGIKQKNNRQLLFVQLLSLGFVALNLAVNYNIYEKFSVMGLALQGRYIFPVLMPLTLCIVAGIFTTKFTKNYKQYHPVLVAVFCAILIWQSGISRILSVDKYVVNKISPVVIAEPQKAIGPWEPGI